MHFSLQTDKYYNAWMYAYSIRVGFFYNVSLIGMADFVYVSKLPDFSTSLIEKNQLINLELVIRLTSRMLNGIT